MRIRHLQIRIKTEKGLFGTDIPFNNGLTILRAGNSMGKSTCVRCIMVALGLEDMLTNSKQDLPLPQVMKSKLLFNDKYINVIESDVYLEVENNNEERIVIHRTIKGERNKDLITVIFGPALTSNKWSFKTKDYFVSRSGAAVREAGFHHFLISFLGWELPKVQTYTNGDVPLYIQCIFPYFFVEQTRGWSSLTPPITTKYRIRDPHKRVVEFILKLDATTIAKKRIEYKNRLNEISAKWNEIITALSNLPKSIGGICKNLPNAPISNWPPKPWPSIIIPNDNEWISFEKLLSLHKQQLISLESEQIPTVRQVVQEDEHDLSKLTDEIKEKELILSNLFGQLELEKAEFHELDTGLESIKKDITRYKDTRTLASLGSIAPNINNKVCPTCHQQIEDSLSPIAQGQEIMTLEDNIKLLEEQKIIYTKTLVNSNKVIQAIEAKITNFQRELNNDRAQIRAVKETLTTDNNSPSIEEIRKRIELEETINLETEISNRFEDGLLDLEVLSESWLRWSSELSNLPKEDISQEDGNKITMWNKIFREQLIAYDFQSIKPNEITISQDTYFPIHQGYDLPSNISASDFIRVIWSYLFGLLEVSQNIKTNHLGFLLYDEPKQQSAKEISFAALLKRASTVYNADQQVIFATSENENSLSTILEKISSPVSLIKFPGRIIQPLNHT